MVSLMAKLPKPAPLPTMPSLRPQVMPSHIASLRYTSRPTVALSTFDATRIQEVILGIFKKYDYAAIDMEALVYFVLQYFHITPATYEVMHKTVKNHIISNFAIHQGSSVRLSEISMRRLTVCYTIDKHED